MKQWHRAFEECSWLIACGKYIINRG